MKVKTDYPGCEYVTAGKEYEVAETHHCNGVSYIINCDEGHHLFIILGDPCAHLDDVGTWSVVEEWKDLSCHECGGNGYTGCATEPTWCHCIGDDV